jgi:8-amino-7-oxononanoate synthase
MLPLAPDSAVHEMPDLVTETGNRLLRLEEQNLLRQRRVVEGAQGPILQVDGKRYLAFASNDYLGLANHPSLLAALRDSLERYGAGAAASAMITGHTRINQHLELALAEFVGMPRALHFSTGYMANLGIIPALVGSGDVVFSDRLNHASIIDGARLSGAQLRVYAHGDFVQLQHLLEKNTRPRPLIATDGVFSMDGTIAPLPELVALAEKYDAWLLVDDAHGFGVLGPQGRGSMAHFGLRSPQVLYMATLGKAAGVAGAFVAGHGTVIEWLLQRARTYVFSTASPPLLSGALLAALKVIETEDLRRVHLGSLVTRLRQGLTGLPWPLLHSETAIQPLVLGDNQLAVAISADLREQGILVPAIRPPTVPKGTARLRISLSAGHSFEQVDQLIAALRGAADRMSGGLDRPW